MSENVQNWSANQRAFMLWLATPTDDRYPVKQGTFAEELGIHERTLSRWKQLPGFIAEVNKIVDEHLADDFAEVVASLKREAKRGNFAHQKLYFEMIGKYTPKQEVGGANGGDIILKVIYDTGNSAAEQTDD